MRERLGGDLAMGGDQIFGRDAGDKKEGSAAKKKDVGAQLHIERKGIRVTGYLAACASSYCAAFSSPLDLKR